MKFFYRDAWRVMGSIFGMCWEAFFACDGNFFYVCWELFEHVLGINLESVGKFISADRQATR